MVWGPVRDYMLGHVFPLSVQEYSDNVTREYDACSTATKMLQDGALSNAIDNWKQNSNNGNNNNANFKFQSSWPISPMARLVVGMSRMESNQTDNNNEHASKSHQYSFPFKFAICVSVFDETLCCLLSCPKPKLACQESVWPRIFRRLRWMTIGQFESN